MRRPPCALSTGFATIVLAIAFNALAGGLAAAQPPAPADPIAAARRLSNEGRRGEAIVLLGRHLAESPDDADAGVVYGTFLSWEGRYDEARAALQRVLDKSPAYLDATLALINVELWSKHPERASTLARLALERTPADTSLLLARARSLNATHHSDEARNIVGRLLLKEPRHADALRLKYALEQGRPWGVSVGHTYDWFSDQRTAWQETTASLKRETPVGSVTARGYRAERFGLYDNQFEIEMYPRLRKGTYMYIAGAMAPDHVLYPEYRYAADIYQGLGRGFEGSVGFRRLAFSTKTSIYVGTMTKYMGSWMLTGKTFYIPDLAGSSVSYHGSFRRYFGADGTSYLGLRYGHGLSREEVQNVSDLEVLKSDTIAGEFDAALGRRLRVSLSGATSRQDRANQIDLRQNTVSASLGVLF